MIKVSVIVPVYNTASYLPKCLDSILSQTLKEIEVIVVNDGSTDNSKQIIDSYATKDARVVVLDRTREIKRGSGAARNAGLKIAKGEFVSYIDSDDWIALDMYENMYNEAIENGCEAVVCGMDFVSEDETVIEKKFVSDKRHIIDNREEFIYTYISDKGGVPDIGESIVSWLTRRDVIFREKLFFIEEDFYAEDGVLACRLVLHIKSVCLVPDNYYFYVQREGSKCSFVTEQTINDWVSTINQKKNLLVKEGVFNGIVRNEFYVTYWLRGTHSLFISIIFNTRYREILKNYFLFKAVQKTIKPLRPYKKTYFDSFKTKILCLIFFSFNEIFLFFFYILLKVIYDFGILKKSPLNRNKKILKDYQEPVVREYVANARS